MNAPTGLKSRVGPCGAKNGDCICSHLQNSANSADYTHCESWIFNFITVSVFLFR